MYYAIEYVQNKSDAFYLESNLGVWDVPGIFLNRDGLIYWLSNQKSYSLKRKDEHTWEMNAGFNYELKIVESFSRKEILEFQSQTIKDKIYKCKPYHEAYFLETNEVISLHQSEYQLEENMNSIMPNHWQYTERLWKIRRFNLINPWQLNIKDALCTTL